MLRMNSVAQSLKIYFVKIAQTLGATEIQPRAERISCSSKLSAFIKGIITKDFAHYVKETQSSGLKHFDNS